ncbi:MAG TPA: hypothetical protein VGM39_18840, partial [Kofleriaceae bacterium]
MKRALLLLACIACDNRESTPDWSRMITQPKLLPYGAASQFSDDRAMRPVPGGTVPRDWIADDERREGRTEEGLPVAVIPVGISRQLLERGQDRFRIACAACH